MSCSRVAIKAIALTFALHRPIDDRRCIRILGEKVGPRFEHDGMNQNNFACDVTRFRKSAVATFPHIDDRDVLHRCKGGAHATETARTRNEDSTVPPPTLVALT